MISDQQPVGPGPRPPDGQPPDPPRRSPAILIVEDDDGDALLVQDQLAEELPHVRLSRARTVAEALALLGHGLDCVLLDLQLPDATGLGAVEMIRARSPAMPLVVLTGLEDEAAGATAVAAGAQDYLLKSQVDGGQLVRAIRYAIARRQAEDANNRVLLAESQAREVARLERGLVPAPPVARGDVWIASCYRAGRRRALLGGDFYDAAESPEGSLRLLIGDVCGHGADEAAIGVCLRSAWRALALAGGPLAEMLPTLQRVFEQERHVPSLFATLCTLELHPAHRSATLVQAGHPAPLLIAGGRALHIAGERPGAAVGVGARAWPERHIELPPDWALLLYTDGIVEGRVGNGPERLGEQRLEQLLEECISGSADLSEHASSLLEDLLERAEELNGGPLTDDVAMIMAGARSAAQA